MTASRLRLTAVAALALAGAAHAQETDSHVASMGEQGFRRFASLCRDQQAACDAAFRFGALVGADAAMRCALADDQIACFKKTMNSQEFMEEEQKAITGQTDPKQ
jgi:lipase chaperone LimK